MGARFDYDPQQQPKPRPGEGLGEQVCCPYCLKVAVTIEEYEPDSEMTTATGETVIDTWAEGDCSNCGQHVEYDYDPIGVVAFEHGRPVRR